MSNFPIHTVSTAPEGSRPVLEAVQQGLGSIPNLFGVFAESPAILKAYTTLSELQDAETAFDETERQVLFLSISAQNGCGYCVAAHSTISGMKGVDADVVRAVREDGPLPTPKLEALRTYARAVVAQRGWTAGADLDAFLAAGWTQRAALEVVLAVAFKTLSNFTTHVSGVELDAMFARQAWTAPAGI
jgi:uncharacterized peroxidase-related enzyme